jgi:hypothetical protein
MGFRVENPLVQVNGAFVIEYQVKVLECLGQPECL